MRKERERVNLNEHIHRGYSKNIHHFVHPVYVYRTNCISKIEAKATKRKRQFATQTDEEKK